MAKKKRGGRHLERGPGWLRGMGAEASGQSSMPSTEAQSGPAERETAAKGRRAEKKRRRG